MRWSELFREMVRVYKRYCTQREQDEERWVIDLIRAAQEGERTNPRTPQEMVAELKEFGREVVAQAKKRGLKQKEVNTIIYEARKRGAA